MMGIWADTISADERAALDALAERRQGNWEGTGATNKRVAVKKGDVAIYRTGAYGEWIACRLLGMPFNWEHTKSDPGHDSILKGRKVEVKATMPWGRYLLFSNLDHFKADLAILTLVDESGPLVRVTLAGWCSKKDFLKRHTIEPVTEAFGPQPVMDRRDLRPMDDLGPMLDRATPPDPPPDDGRPSWLDTSEPFEDLYTGPPERRGPVERETDGLDELVPPEYRGRTWDYATPTGVVASRFPPIRDDPQGPVTQEFQDFQMHGGRVTRQNHPEYYCVTCRAVYVTAVCTHPDCGRARTAPTGAPRTAEGTPYRCLECRREFNAALICGGCRSKLDPIQESLLPRPYVGRGHVTKRRGKPDEVYPD
jgi:hypothetical protein